MTEPVAQRIVHASPPPIKSLGIKIYNVFDSGNERDVQTNITAPDYGRSYNPIQRSIGFVLGTTRP